MQTYDCDTPSLSLVSWARTARPVRFGSLLRSAVRAPATDGTDDVLFGCSAVALILTPVVALIVVLFG